MDKNQKKQMRQEWRSQQRADALEALPLPAEEMKSLFDFLDSALLEKGCDRTRRFTESWLDEHQHEVEKVFAWLDTNGGFCDCGVLANCEQAFQEAMRGTHE